MESAPILSVPFQQARRGVDHLARGNPGETSEVAGLAYALVAWAAGQARNFHRDCGKRGRAPWTGTRGQGRAVERHHGYPARRGNVHGTAVAADVEGGEL